MTMAMTKTFRPGQAQHWANNVTGTSCVRANSRLMYKARNCVWDVAIYQFFKMLGLVSAIKCKLQCRDASKLSAVGTLCFFTVHSRYHSDHWRKLNYEGEIFVQKLCSVLKIFTNEALHCKSWFKSGSPESRSRMLSTNLSIQWWYYEPEKQNRDQKGPVVVKIIEKQCAHAQDEERRAAFKIGVSDSRRGMFSALASV